MCIDIEVSNFCCCIDLKTGSAVIGYTGLMLSGLTAIFIGDTMYMAYEVDQFENAFFSFIIVMYVVMAFCILHFISSGCLILGIHKNSRRWIKAFIVYLNIFIGNQIITLIYHILTVNFIPMLNDLPLIIILIYILAVVNGYHKELGKNPMAAVISPDTDPDVNDLTPNTTPMAGITNSATGPVGNGLPSDVHKATVTGPVGLGAPNNGYTAAVAGPVTYETPAFELTGAAPVDCSNNVHIDTRL